VEHYLARRPPAEWNLVLSMLRRMVIVGPAALVIFGIIRGLKGAIAAAIGLAIVVGYYLLAGMLMSRLARISLGAYHAGALFGFVARLGLTAATMLGVAALFEVDRLALGLTVISTYLAILLWEAARLGKKPTTESNPVQRTRSAEKRSARSHG